MAEAVTVAWMLSTFATLIAELATIATWVLALAFVEAGDKFRPLSSLPGLLLCMAVIIGVVSLILGPIAQNMRQASAPTAVAAFAFAVGALPMLILVVFVLLSRV